MTSSVWDCGVGGHILHRHGCFSPRPTMHLGLADWGAYLKGTKTPLIGRPTRRGRGLKNTVCVLQFPPPPKWSANQKWAEHMQVCGWWKQEVTSSSLPSLLHSPFILEPEVKRSYFLWEFPRVVVGQKWAESYRVMAAAAAAAPCLSVVSLLWTGAALSPTAASSLALSLPLSVARPSLVWETQKGGASAHRLSLETPPFLPPPPPPVANSPLVLHLVLLLILFLVLLLILLLVLLLLLILLWFST